MPELPARPPDCFFPIIAPKQAAALPVTPSECPAQVRGRTQRASAPASPPALREMLPCLHIPNARRPPWLPVLTFAPLFATKTTKRCNAEQLRFLFIMGASATPPLFCRYSQGIFKYIVASNIFRHRGWNKLLFSLQMPTCITTIKKPQFIFLRKNRENGNFHLFFQIHRAERNGKQLKLS